MLLPRRVREAPATEGPGTIRTAPARGHGLACGAAAVALSFWLLGSLWSLGRAAAEDRRQPATHTVTIDATSYRPRTLTVAAGDSVVWVNKDLLAHTATAKNGSFDSKDIPAGGSWTYRVGSEGLFAYTCLYHPTMKATLRVR
jgi:plastocyanin